MTMKVFVWLLSLLCSLIASAEALPDPPVLEQTARVKQHRAGATGDLVAGEGALSQM